MKHIYLTLLTLLLTNFYTFSQDCGCDHYVSLDLDEVDGSGYEPGDVVCVTSGTRLQLRFENIEGTPDNPITIKNCGGEVLINAPYSPHGIEFLNCSHVRLSGSGDDELTHGFRILNNQECGISFGNLSNFFEIDHVRIAGTEGPGILVKEEPRCDLTANEGYFLLENVRIHDVEIFDCAAGINIGHPDFHYGLINEDCGALFPYGVKDLEIRNVNIQDVNAGNGITVYGATGKIENCVINEIAGNGIVTGTWSSMTIDQNEISNTYLYGLRAEGSSRHKIRNNVFFENSGVGVGSVWIEFFAAVGGGDYNSLEFRHNTSINSGSYNLTIANPTAATELCLIQNNLFSESMVPLAFYGDYGGYLNIDESELYLVEDNTYAPTRDYFNFVDADANDFRLTHESPVINDGADLGVEEDFLGQIRNLAGAPDLGAFEYVPEPIAYFAEIPLVGLYVDDFKNIIGDEEAETQLLEFARDSGFNYLLLYNLAYIHDHHGDLDDPVESVFLADFIERAKSQYGIAQVGAVGETNASFDKIEAFNSFNSNNWFRKFDVINMEFEFWTDNDALLDYYCDNYLSGAGHPCTNAGAYDYYEGQLEDIDARADDMGIISEIYIGYTSDAQSIALAERCDRMLLHHYRTTDTYGDGTSIYNYHTYRIRAIALSDRKPAVMPIFSSRSYHMGPWLEDHSLHQPMETWLYGLEGYYDDDSEGVHELPISGFQWYRYTSFLDIGSGFMAPEFDESGVQNDAQIEMNIIQTSFGTQVQVSSEDEWPEGDYYCVLLDVQGRQIAQYPVANITNDQILLEGLEAGVYICQIIGNGASLKASKMVIR